MVVEQSIKKIAIIGGGPSGMASVKTLNTEKCDFDIDLYDSRANLGGIWNYFPTKSQYNDDHELVANDEYNHSPLYANLETNILYKSMEFTNFHFPEESVDFPFRTEVLDYLTKYSKTLGPYNKYLNTRVTGVEKNGDSWELVSKNVVSGEVTTRLYDAVVVANGHFEVPRIPEVDGLDEWKKRDPKSITHAKFFDTPSRYKDKTVLVVGGIASGSDIAIQSSATAKKVYVSCDETTILSNINNPFIEIIPRIESYDVNTRSVSFGGEKVSDIDEVIFCTGYLYDVPFLKLDICKKRYIQDLYRQMFYVQDPSLTFVGLGKDVSPFPFAEAQSSIIARYYSGRLKLPTSDEMKSVADEELKTKGDRLHGLKFPKEGEYINGLFQLLEDRDLLDGVERKKKVPEVKLKRVINNNQRILDERGVFGI
ncbi:FAD/NAD(P)-binding domain-containing protein [Yamadazyma tenuis ATCC 10573]|uniref:FAD/NAD(P)-binding domain-containing protein n=1 Tax=Candida tenuis (strain ATCC 10573 / BCRC 21748 / CBS 615 / JCM 9827 / NBRC 10315 / NRRL Y-1498 / VKM Y-70) TaxID=590646 RepID=G3B0S4_CANTC|nr:FAD/NAD(P)-binding domain-containing protein [Yamadazyma tenuis ATCC 10573]EGV64789.1 FAD/NAD(P)-binding domain-containing protein [Yamadazyma tenuis ATCC 10573]